MRKLTAAEKETLRLARRDAYQKAKEKRDIDPKYLALKEAQKQKQIATRCGENTSLTCHARVN